MSLPGAQPPDPYQQPNPYQQQPGPPNPYQQPRPQQQQQPAAPPPNPYTQAPLLPGSGPGAGAAGGYGPGQAPPPPVPPGGGGKGWLWGLGGVVAASAVWLAALTATGTLGEDGETSPDLAGYRFHKDMCETAELDSFWEHYETDSTDEPFQYATEEDALDVSFCNQSLEDPADSNSYASAYLSITVEWHKGADPSGEFASRWEGYEQRDSDDRDFTVEQVDGIGSEAFLVTETGSASGDDDDALSGMTLAIRDGWLTFEMDWRSFSSSDEDAGLSPDEVADMLRSDSEAALKELRKPDDSAPGRDSDSDSDSDVDDTSGGGGEDGPGAPDGQEDI